jgi:hypothetical protein
MSIAGTTFNANFSVNDMATKPLSIVVRSFDRASRAAVLMGMQMVQLAQRLRGVIDIGHRFAQALGPLGPILAGVGIGTLISQVVELNSELENTVMKLGGVFTALGVTEDFATGTRAATRELDKLVLAAARLPGEVGDYVEVYQAGLAPMVGAFGGSLDQMMDFSTRFTAFGKIMGVDARQIGRDMQLILSPGRGRAGAAVRTWKQLLPFIEKAQGRSLTTDQVNVMSQVDRAKLVMSGLDLTKPMIDASANTWDAIWGTFKSNARLAFRDMTSSLFSRIKDGFKQINSLMYDSAGKMRPWLATLTTASNLLWDGIGQALEHMLGVTDKITSAFKTKLPTALDKVLAYLQKIAAPIGMIANTIGSGVARLGRAVSNAPGGAGAMAASQGGMAVSAGIAGSTAAVVGASVVGLVQTLTLGLGAAVAGLFVALGAGPLAAYVMPLFSAVGTLWGAVAGIVSAIVTFTTVFTGIYGFIAGIYGVLADTVKFGLVMEYLNVIVGTSIKGYEALTLMLNETFVSVGGDISTAMVYLLRWFTLAYTWAVPMFVGAIWVLLGMFKVFWRTINWVVQKLNDFANQVTGVIVELLKYADLISAYLASTGGIVGAIMELVNAVITKINEWTGANTELMDMSAVTKFLKSLTSGGIDKDVETARRGNDAGVPPERGGNVQDFRYSRFEISQKFEEGFDPDRIATVMADRFGRISEHRLQSGLAPMFAVR